MFFGCNSLMFRCCCSVLTRAYDVVFYLVFLSACFHCVSFSFSFLCYLFYEQGEQGGAEGWRKEASNGRRK